MIIINHGIEIQELPKKIHTLAASMIQVNTYSSFRSPRD